MKRVWPVLGLLLATQGQAGFAQATGSNAFGPAKDNIIRIRDTANRQCITLKGTVRPEIINKDISDHVILADNICPKIIRVKACYLHSKRCVEFDLHSREKKEVLLGTMPHSPDFRFEYTEKQLF